MLEKKKIIIKISNNLIRAAIAAVAAAIIISFASKQISKINYSSAEKKRLTAIIEKRSETITKIKNDLVVIGNGEEKIKNALPGIDNILNFVSALENTANKNLLQSSYKFGIPAPYLKQENLEILSVNYNLNVNGTISTLISYLKDIEKLPYFTNIESVNFNSHAGWDNNSTISFQAKLFVKQ